MSSASESIYTAIMNGAPFHISTPTLSTKAAMIAYAAVLLVLPPFMPLSVIRRASMIGIPMKVSPLYTSAAVLAMLPAETATNNIARSPQSLLSDSSFARK